MSYNTTKPYSKKIKELIKETWNTPLCYVHDYHPYPYVMRKFSHTLEVDHTDGVGTKGYYHWDKTCANAAIDAMAMNLNDLAMVRATPYKMQNHIVLPEENNEVLFAIVSKLVELCKTYDIALTGGETSIQDISSFDISVTMTGFIYNKTLNRFCEGDILIGLPSSGLHSNGFTKVRDLFWNKPVMQEFVEPTAIYHALVAQADWEYGIKGICHITGGAYTKLLPFADEVDIILNNMPCQEIFHKIYEFYKGGISDEEMYKTFNCGVGMVLSVPADKSHEICDFVKGQIIGKIVKGTGKVIINSRFSDKVVELV